MFTCAVYRAVLSELVTSLATGAFIEAMKRFIARKERPRIIYSDNGTNFVGLESALSTLDWVAIKKFSTVHQNHVEISILPQLHGWEDGRKG